MNTGIFGEGFPYSNFHDLNMDWIIKIAKDFLDQYTHIQEIIANGEESLQNQTTSGLEALQTKADALEALLQQWYNTHSEDIANQLADALNDMQTALTNALNDMQTALTQNLSDFQSGADARAQQAIATIPEDYTDFYNASCIYKGTLINTNIDTFRGNGWYFISTTSVAGNSGSFPSIIRNQEYFLVQRDYNGLRLQKLISAEFGTVYYRKGTALNVWTDWIGTSRILDKNVWNGDTEYTFTNYIVIGTTGTTLYPAGRYTFYCDIDTEATSVNIIIYDSDGQVALARQYYMSLGHKIYMGFETENPVERIFISGLGASVDGTIYNIKMIKDVLWMNYRGPNTDLYESVEYPCGITSGVEETFKSYWEGKHIVYNGDSLTQNQPNTYTNITNNLLQFGKVDNYAIGGSRLAHIDGQQYAMVDRITDMTTDNVDIVFIMANTNDYASQVPLGDADSTDTETYNGALNTICTYLKTAYPTQPIVLSTPLTRKINYQEGTSTPLPIAPEEYAQAVLDCAKRHKLIPFDAFWGTGLDLLNSPLNAITADRLHLNAKGCELFGTRVAKFINNL